MAGRWIGRHTGGHVVARWVFLIAGMSGVVGLGVQANSIDLVGSVTTPTLPDPLSTVCQVAGPCWSVTQALNAGSSATLTGVSCTSSSLCLAVGYSEGAGTQPIVEEWNGSSWSMMFALDPGYTARFNGISCSSASFCVAVGSFQEALNYGPGEYTGTGIYQALAEEWNGSSWSVTNPTEPGTSPWLSGVSCTSSIDCVAVGNFSNTAGTETLAEVWDGVSWSMMNTPTTNNTQFNGVSCTSSRFCVATGLGASGSLQDTLAADWDGTRWSVMTTTNPGTGGNRLTGVSCAASAACTAVGDYYNYYGPHQAMAEAWDGASWTTMTTQTPGGQGWLNAVSCASVVSCVGVGLDATPSPLAEQSLGLMWTTMSTAAPNSYGSIFNGVSCPTSVFCMAVGTSNVYPDSGIIQALAEVYPTAPSSGI